jgi:peptidoglycan-associated lipoprotein
MRSPTKRFALLALLALVVLIPACSKDAPPAPAPAPVPPPAPAPAPERDEVPPPDAGEWEVADAAEEESFLSADQINARQLLRTIHFDFDSAEIRGDQRATLQANADWLREHPDVRILIEGHCDERGTRDYNQALGAQRAQAASAYLSSLGISAQRIETISYGEENPIAMGEGEQFWSQNRRSEFVAVTSERGTT